MRANAERRNRSFDIHSAFWLLCRVGTHLCALPLGSVVEIMRPLPVEPIIDSQRFIQGISIVRGVPTPVVATALLFDEQGNEPQRWVTVKSGERLVVLAVDTVLGVSSIDASLGNELPPLLKDAVGDVVSAIGTLDAELLLFLNTARIVPKAIQEAIILEAPKE